MSNTKPSQGSEPELARISVEKLFVDHDNYQRRKKQSIMSKLGAWNWKLCQPLQVSRRANGMFAILDGQHRFNLALETGGITHLPCAIVAANSIEDEAGVFNGINTKRGNTNSYDYLRSMIAMGDKDAITISLAVKRHGFELAPVIDANKIGAASALMKAYEDYGLTALDSALQTIRDSWGGEKDSLTHSFILGLSQFYYCASRSGFHVHHDDFIKNLGKMTPSQVQRMFPEFVKGTAHRGALAFCGVYNKNRRSSKIRENIFGRSIPMDTRSTPKSSTNLKDVIKRHDVVQRRTATIS